jgi:predicted permease
MNFVKEEVREMWGWNSVETLWQDVRYALRMLRRMPGFTAVVVISLALGVGLNSSVFSVINALLLRPLPVPVPDRLVRIYQHSYGNTSYRNYRDLRAHNATMESLAAFSWPNPVALAIPTGQGPLQTEQAWSAAVSANYFDMLRVRPQLGRTFLPEEDASAGKAPVVVISDQLWRTRFHGDPSVLGRTVRINNHSFVVIGVAPANVPQPEALFVHQLWLLVTMCNEVGIGNRLENRRQSWLRMIGRLKPEATLSQLQVEVKVIASQIASADPRNARNLTFTPYRETDARFRGLPGVRQFGWILQAVVALVLVIACANIVNLQLARALARTKEIGIRLAIGASRVRILRQFITENLLLALVGGTLGILSAVWGARILLSLAPPTPVPADINVSPDWRVLSFGLALSMIIGVLLGLVTATATAKGGLSSQLKSGGVLTRSSTRWFSPRNLLVGSQVALSVVLLIAAGLFLESLRNARRLDLGFQPENRLTVSVNPGMQGYNEEQGVALHTEALRRTRFLPGVVSVSSTAVLPLSGGYLGDGFVWPEGDSHPSDAGRPMVYFDRVGAGYFETMGATLLAGREFTERDRKGSPLVAVVNETFARSFWPGERAIGKRFRTSGPDGPLIEIVGLVRDGKYHSLGEAPQRHVYLPFLQGYTASFAFVLKTVGDPRSLAGVARAELRKPDSALPITNIKTLNEHLGFAYWGAEFGAGLLSTFALLGLVLSAVGLYGVLAFMVNRNISEVGIRMALGATPSTVLRHFVRRGLAISVVGVFAGTLAALATTRALASYLYWVSPSNPAIFATVAALLLAVAFVASYLPSRRAARIEPFRALRHE